MENRELDEAIDWLRRTVDLEEKILSQVHSEEEKREMFVSLERKRNLLEKLETLNLKLNAF